MSHVAIKHAKIRPAPRPDDGAGRRRRIAVRKAAILTATLGILHALLFMSAALLLKSQTPGLGATDDELVAFYKDSNERRVVIVAGLYLLPFAGIAFIWFFIALRSWISASAPRVNVILSNVQLVSGIIYTTLVLAAGASMSVTALTVESSDVDIDPLLARQFPQFGTSLLLVFAMRMAAMFVLTTTNLGRLSGILPRWFVLVGFVVAAVLLLTASLSSWLVLVFPGWILIACVILIERARKVPRTLIVDDSHILPTYREITRP